MQTFPTKRELRIFSHYKYQDFEASSMKDKVEESLCFKWLNYGPASRQRDGSEDIPQGSLNFQHSVKLRLHFTFLPSTLKMARNDILLLECIFPSKICLQAGVWVLKGWALAPFCQTHISRALFLHFNWISVPDPLSRLLFSASLMFGWLPGFW